MTTRAAIVTATVLLALIVTVVVSMVRVNHSFAVHQQQVTNCEFVYGYTAKQCAKLYP